MFRPACMTAPSGLTMTAVARPCFNQRPSLLSPATETIAAPRVLSSFCCTAVNGDEVTSAKNRVGTQRSGQLPGGTGFDHQCRLAQPGGDAVGDAGARTRQAQVR